MKTTLTSADPSGWYEFACNSLGRQVAHWDGQYLRGGGYTFYQPNCRNFRRLYYESDVAALREELTALRDEVKRLKSQPYEMRRAERPDCIGLWMSVDGDVYSIPLEVQLQNYTWRGPYHYLGPIPVVVEQQPPKVVKVKHKTSGEAFRAIPSPCGKWQAIIGNDGSFLGNESVDNWEEVQS